MSHTFSVLVVCTGNICRSPVAEQLLRARFGAAGMSVIVRSAGTSALEGIDMTDEAAALARQYGGTGAGHIARQLTADLVADADLVLTATREHRHAVVALHPRAARYAYTLIQFARLVDAVDSSTLDRSGSDGPLVLLNEVAATRGFAPPPKHPDLDDITDPYRRSQEVYDDAGRAIDAATTTIVAGVTGAAGARAGQA